MMPSVERPRNERMVKPWRQVVLAGGVVALLLVLLTARRRLQRRHLYRPHDGERRAWGPDVWRQDVFFEATAGGPRLHGIWWPHPRARATVLFCHGQRGTLAGMEADLALLRSRLEVDLLAFDYRGYGSSAGVPSEAGLYADARGAHRYAVATLGIDPSRLVLFGHSLGSAVAIDAARDCEIAGLIVQSGFTDVREMARVKFPGWPVHWLARNEFRSIEKVPTLTMPKLFIHGTADATVPIEHARRLFEAAALPKTFVMVEGADHNEVARRGGLRWAMTVRRFVEGACGRMR